MGKFGEAHAYRESATWIWRWPSTNQRVRPGTDSSLTASEGTILANTLILNLILILPPELWDDSCCLSCPVIGTNKLIQVTSFVVVPGFEARQVSLFGSSVVFILVPVSVCLSLLASLALITLSSSSSLLSFCHSLSLCLLSAHPLKLSPSFPPGLFLTHVCLCPWGTLLTFRN